ncbi:MAG: hypothetical protein AABZ39_00260 [Spirochaetota bacterium]
MSIRTKKPTAAHEPDNEMTFVSGKDAVAVRISGYQYPNTDEYQPEDIEWLMVDVKAVYQGKRWTCTDACLRCRDLPLLREYFTAARDDMPKGTVFRSIEPNLQFHASAPDTHREITIILSMELLPKCIRNEVISIRCRVRRTDMLRYTDVIRRWEKEYPDRKDETPKHVPRRRMNWKNIVEITV